MAQAAWLPAMFPRKVWPPATLPVLSARWVPGHDCWLATPACDWLNPPAMNPLVSVVMPVWNGEKYLAPAVDSILAQTFRNFEFIIVDDGSTDDTSNILKSYSDSRLQVHRLNHTGIVTALNHGIAHARSAWIARQDADDVSLPQRLEKQWVALKRSPQAVLAHTAVEFIGEGSAGIGQARVPRSRSLTALRLCCQCPIVHSTTMFLKDAALAAGGYRQEERHAEDFALWGRLLAENEFVCLPERLVHFRVHPESVSRQNLETQAMLARKIAITHCEKFLQLNQDDATRAYSILAAPIGKRTWRDWQWFLTACAPRLRWRSAESKAWLWWQTARLLNQKLLHRTNCSPGGNS